jgi:hypothetical protein
MNRDRDSSEGMGAIIAVVAIAALVIMGMLYIMQPPTDAPATTTTQAPAGPNSPPAQPKSPGAN